MLRLDKTSKVIKSNPQPTTPVEPPEPSFRGSVLLRLPCVLFRDRYVQENKAVWHLPRQLREAPVPVAEQWSRRGGDGAALSTVCLKKQRIDECDSQEMRRVGGTWLCGTGPSWVCHPAASDSGCDMFAEEETVSSLQCCLCVFPSPPRQRVVAITFTRPELFPQRRLRGPCFGRGLGWVTHRGPFQPRPFCDSEAWVSPACGGVAVLLRVAGLEARLSTRSPPHRRPPLPEKTLPPRRAPPDPGVVKRQSSAWKRSSALGVSPREVGQNPMQTRKNPQPR